MEGPLTPELTSRLNGVLWIMAGTMMGLCGRADCGGHDDYRHALCEGNGHLFSPRFLDVLFSMFIGV